MMGIKSGWIMSFLVLLVLSMLLHKSKGMQESISNVLTDWTQRRHESRANGITCHVTCDNTMRFYADDVLLKESTEWTVTDTVTVPQGTSTISIQCEDIGGSAGILASCDNGMVTDDSWECAILNSGCWESAYEIGSNGMGPWNEKTSAISGDAKWIWRGSEWSPPAEDNKDVTCRKTLRDSVCQTGYTFVPHGTAGSCYKLQDPPMKVPYSEAFASCDSDKGTLASMPTQEEYDALIHWLSITGRNVKNKEDLWVGLEYAGSSTGPWGTGTDYLWLDGTPALDTMWVPQEPSPGMSFFTQVGPPTNIVIWRKKATPHANTAASTLDNRSPKWKASFVCEKKACLVASCNSCSDAGVCSGCEDGYTLTNDMCQLTTCTTTTTAAPKPAPTVVPCADYGRDVIFVLDSSDSVRDLNPADGSYDNWNLMLTFVVEIIDNLDVGPAQQQIRIGVVEFGSTAHVVFDTNEYTDKAVIKEKIKTLKYSGGRTFTAGGIQKAKELIESDTRPDSPNFVVLLTDGHPTKFAEYTVPTAEEVKDLGARILVVGVTEHVKEPDADVLLKAVASSPWQNNYWTSPDFVNLQRVVQTITDSICPTLG